MFARRLTNLSASGLQHTAATLFLSFDHYRSGGDITGIPDHITGN
jgi:hypothetical protein